MDRKLFIDVVIVFTLMATLVFSAIGLISQNIVIHFLLATTLLVSGTVLLAYGIKHKNPVILIAIVFLLASMMIFNISIKLS